MKHVIPFLLALLICTLNINAQIAIIPKPNGIIMSEGKFNFAKGLAIKIIRGDETTKILNQQLTDYFKRNNIALISSSNASLSINLLKENTIPNDAYELNITPNSVSITSSTNAGLFYGMQSLFQLINADSLKVLPCMQIKDQPAFSYRGFQLDACHHFFKTETIKQYLDKVSNLKLNQFVWQLTDESTWRIESKKYKTLVDSSFIKSNNFYTQDEIKQVVQYAKERFITVIPEISFSLLNLADDTSFQYKKNIIDEVTALFPAKSVCVSNINFYAKDVEAYIKSKGKKVIHIDNVAAKEDIVLSYKNTTAGLNAVKNGNDVIMAPHNLCSLDNYQDWDDSKLSISMLYLPIDKVYAFDPTAKIKDEKLKQHIIGGQANVDTKFIDTNEKLSQHIYPRIFALAECLWTIKINKSTFKDFSSRLEKIGYPGQITEKVNLVKFK